MDVPPPRAAPPRPARVLVGHDALCHLRGVPFDLNRCDGQLGKETGLGGVAARRRGGAAAWRLDVVATDWLTRDAVRPELPELTDLSYLSS